LALEWALQTDVAAELRIAASLLWFWFTRHYFVESTDWLEQGLAAGEMAQKEISSDVYRLAVRAKALSALGFFRWMQIPNHTPKNYAPENAPVLLEEAFSIYQSITSHPQPGQQPELRVKIRNEYAWAMVWMGGYLISQDRDLNQARNWFQNALQIFRETGDQFGIAESISMMGRSEAGNPERAKQFLLEQLSITKAIGDIAGSASALSFFGIVSFLNGEYGNALNALKESLELYQRVKDPVLIAQELIGLGLCSIAMGDLKSAQDYTHQSLSMSKENGHDNRYAIDLLVKCLLCISQGLYVQAEETNAQAWALYERSGIPEIASYGLYVRARLARLAGDAVQSQKYSQELQNLVKIKNSQMWLALLELGHLALDQRDFKQAGKLWREAIRTVQSGFFNWNLCFLEAVALLIAQEGQMERSTRLFGSRWSRGAYHYLAPPERAQRDAILVELKTTLGEARFEQLYAEGQALTLEQAVALALEET
jgi:tetratricopeptide (TPR) repeat protein